MEPGLGRGGGLSPRGGLRADEAEGLEKEQYGDHVGILLPWLGLRGGCQEFPTGRDLRRGGL